MKKQINDIRYKINDTLQQFEFVNGTDGATGRKKSAMTNEEKARIITIVSVVFVILAALAIGILIYRKMYRGYSTQSAAEGKDSANVASLGFSDPAAKDRFIREYLPTYRNKWEAVMSKWAKETKPKLDAAALNYKSNVALLGPGWCKLVDGAANHDPKRNCDKNNKRCLEAITNYVPDDTGQKITDHINQLYQNDITEIDTSLKNLKPVLT